MLTRGQITHVNICTQIAGAQPPQRVGSRIDDDIHLCARGSGQSFVVDDDVTFIEPFDRDGNVLELCSLIRVCGV